MPKTTYVWDELSDNVIEEYEDGVLTVSYTHEPGLYGNLLSQNRNGVTSHYHYDGRGDTVALTDDSGNITDTKEYDAWGNVIVSTGSTVTPYQFGGRHGYQTGNTGVYIRARMYQPTVSRWASIDPILFFDTLNALLYVQNRSIGFVDPSGNIGINTVSTVLGNCGEFSWVTEWVLGANEQNGFIVQRVCRHLTELKCVDSESCKSTALPLANCENGNKCDTSCYWELWPVREGRSVLIDRVSKRDPIDLENARFGGDLKDTFANSGCVNFKESCTKGRLRQTGEVLFVPSEDVRLPQVKEFLKHFSNGKNGVRSACNLLSTCDDQSPGPLNPNGNPSKQLDIFNFLRWYFSSDGKSSKFKDSRLEWDCCGDLCVGNICKGTDGITLNEHVIY